MPAFKLKPAMTIFAKKEKRYVSVKPWDKELTYEIHVPGPEPSEGAGLEFAKEFSKEFTVTVVYHPLAEDADAVLSELETEYVQSLSDEDVAAGEEAPTADAGPAAVGRLAELLDELAAALSTASAASPVNSSICPVDGGAASEVASSVGGTVESEASIVADFLAAGGSGGHAPAPFGPVVFSGAAVSAGHSGCSGGISGGNVTTADTQASGETGDGNETLVAGQSGDGAKSL